MELRLSEIIKRLFDFFASAVGLVLLWPVIAIAMIAVRYTSLGPAIFAHTRVGRDGRHFTLFKLRTMQHGSVQGPTHVVGSDTMTAIGSFLRRSKLDELPQLMNVLKGEMSLVGPRPCLPTQTELIAARQRESALSVRPGITGLAQVRGIDMSDPAKLAAIDGLYVRNRSFITDVRLILLTIGGRGRGMDPAARSKAIDKSSS
jgi:O-antigen biosynthesis protein WbqP